MFKATSSLMPYMQVKKMRAEITKMKVAPSAIGGVERAKLCFSALTNCPVSVWRFPSSGSMPDVAGVPKNTIRGSATEILASFEDNVYENAESGMCGRAMVMLTELCHMCKDITPAGSKLKVYSPLKLDDLKRVEFGLVLIVMVSYL